MLFLTENVPIINVTRSCSSTPAQVSWCFPAPPCCYVVFISSLLPSFTLLRPHHPPYTPPCSQDALQPHGLCTDCPLCLKCSFYRHMTHSLVPSRFYSNAIFSRIHTITTIAKVAPHCFSVLISKCHSLSALGNKLRI